MSNIYECPYECPICMENYSMLNKLECSHEFCAQCLTKSSKINIQCPICRKPTNQRYINKNFFNKVYNIIKILPFSRKIEKICIVCKNLIGETSLIYSTLFINV